MGTWYNVPSRWVTCQGIGHLMEKNRKEDDAGSNGYMQEKAVAAPDIRHEEEMTNPLVKDEARHPDRRIQRTRRSLAQALVALTLAQDYDSITVRDITEYANIAHATFYRHYRDKEALLESVLELDIDELSQIFSRTAAQTTLVEGGQQLFEYVKQHNEVIRVLLRSGHASLFIGRIVQSTLERYDLPAAHPVPRAIAANHIVTTSIALIQWWIEHDMPYSPQQMGEIYYELVMKPIGR